MIDGVVAETFPVILAARSRCSCCLVCADADTPSGGRSASASCFLVPRPRVVLSGFVSAMPLSKIFGALLLYVSSSTTWRCCSSGCLPVLLHKVRKGGLSCQGLMVLAAILILPKRGLGLVCRTLSPFCGLFVKLNNSPYVTQLNYIYDETSIRRTENLSKSR